MLIDQITRRVDHKNRTVAEIVEDENHGIFYYIKLILFIAYVNVNYTFFR